MSSILALDSIGAFIGQGGSTGCIFAITDRTFAFTTRANRRWRRCGQTKFRCLSMHSLSALGGARQSASGCDRLVGTSLPEPTNRSLGCIHANLSGAHHRMPPTQRSLLRRAMGWASTSTKLWRSSMPMFKSKPLAESRAGPNSARAIARTRQLCRLTLEDCISMAIQNSKMLASSTDRTCNRAASQALCSARGPGQALASTMLRSRLPPQYTTTSHRQ